MFPLVLDNILSHTFDGTIKHKRSLTPYISETQTSSHRGKTTLQLDSSLREQRKHLSRIGTHTTFSGIVIIAFGEVRQAKLNTVQCHSLVPSFVAFGDN